MHIDCDCHFFPNDAFDYVDERFAAAKPRLGFNEDGGLAGIDFSGRPAQLPGTNPLPPPGGGSGRAGMCDIDARIEEYDRMGVDRQLLVPQMTGWWSYLIEPELAAALARSWNQAILRAVERYPKRAWGVALIPLQHLEASLEELAWADANAFRAVCLNFCFPVWDHPYGTPTACHREVWPFFERCQELDMPIILHNVPHGHSMVNLLNFQRDGLDFFAPSDAQMNLVALITTGLLDRYPGLKIIHAEQGTGHIERLAQSLDARFKHIASSYEEEEGATAVSRRKPVSKTPQLVPPDEAKEKNQLPPSHYFKHNFWWTIETEEPALAGAVEFLGADRFLFATDYPHEDPGGRMKFKDVELLAANDRIPDDDKQLIRSENARKLFRLD